MFGILVKNWSSVHDESEETYLDIGLLLGTEDGEDKIFLTIYKETVYVSVGGLSYADIIYKGPFF